MPNPPPPIRAVSVHRPIVAPGSSAGLDAAVTSVRPVGGDHFGVPLVVGVAVVAHPVAGEQLVGLARAVEVDRRGEVAPAGEAEIAGAGAAHARLQIVAVLGAP